MSVEPKDAELVLQIRSGNHDAEDLAQMVLMTTIEALRASRLREPEKPAAFVLGTCRMTALDLHRGAQRKERILARFGADLAKPTAIPIPDLDHDQLARCVRNLRERTVVVMSFFHEQTGADATGFPGVSEANLRVIRHRAIHELRKSLEWAA